MSTDTTVRPPVAANASGGPNTPRKRSRANRSAWLRVLEYGTPLVIAAIWWFADELGVTTFFFPSLETIVERFPEVWNGTTLVRDVVPTLTAILLGFAVSCIAGIGFGLLLGLNPRVNEFLLPLLEFFRAMPAIAAVPLFIILLGVGMEMKVGCIVFAAIWPVLLNTTDGVRGVDKTMLDTASSYQLTPYWRITRLILPAASPSIVAGMRVALAQSMVLIIISELVASSAGIGNVISDATGKFDLVAVWTGICFMAIVAFVLSKLFEMFEHRILAWHRGLHGREES